MNNYRNDIQFLDFSNLDATSKEELTAILTSNTNVENLKLPWEKGNITYEPLVEPIPAQEAPKMWHHFVPDVDANVIKYESHANASSVLVTMPSSIPYGAPIMQPLYQEWPTNVYNISDPNVHTYMQPVYGAASNVYSANTESQEISIRENGRRSSRGRSNSGGNKNYSRNMGHANDIHTNYISDHSQYSIATVPFQPVYCHPDPSMLSPQQHHPNATVQPIYYSHQVYHPPTIPQQQSTHRMDYSPYHQSPTNNVKYSRQTQLLLPNQINGDTMTKTSSITNNNNNTSHIVQSFDKRLQSNNNMSKPTILHTLDDDNNSSQTNIVTTVIVNNSNNHRDSSINEIDDNLPNHINNNGNNNNNFNNNNNNTNNTSNNKKYDFKIEQHYKINENCKGSEKSKVVPCVNIKSSIEVKQNGNDNITKEYDDSVSSLIVKEPSSSYPSSTPITNSSSKITSEEVLNTDVQANEISKTEVEIKKNETCAKNSLEPSVNSETSTTISSSTLTTSTTTTTSANKSWASLLKTGTDSQNVSNNFSKPTALIAPNSSAQTNGNETVIDSKPQNVKNSHKKLPIVSNDIKHKNEVVEQNKSVSNEPSAHCDDPTIYRMGEFLLSYKMEKQTVSLLPRGLTNRSNYCYINSILQALLACPPFYNLLMAMPHSKNPSKHSRSPLLDNMIQFVHEFSLLPEGARLARKDRTQKRSGEAVMDIQCGVPFEPSYIYAILKNTSTPGAFSEEGRQEDAEEFLSCLLNGISDEMLELMKLANSNNQKSVPCNSTNAIQNQDDDDWKIMGPKNKGSITRCTDFGRTPLSDIFRGQLRSRVSRAQEEATDYVQPFFTLQLDVEKAQSVKDALDILVGKDALEGMTCSITNQEIEAWKQLTLEELPVILILHLKWFDYKPDGCSKIVKTVEFPVDLKIDNKLLSLNTKSKLNTKQKTYKLFAVTYHDGKEATKGHYVTDAFHVGYGGWVRYDDSSLKGVSEENVLKPQPPRVPYLLYYRRCDTIGNNQSNNVRNR